MNTIYSRHINDVKRTHEYTSQVVTGLKLMQIFCEYNEYYPMVWIQVVNREFVSSYLGSIKHLPVGVEKESLNII